MIELTKEDWQRELRGAQVSYREGLMTAAVAKNVIKLADAMLAEIDAKKDA